MQYSRPAFLPFRILSELAKCVEKVYSFFVYLLAYWFFNQAICLLIRVIKAKVPPWYAFKRGVVETVTAKIVLLF